jgi:hypothetical protein
VVQDEETLEVVNVLGQSVKTVILTALEGFTEVEGLTPGVYLVVLKNKNKVQLHKKLLITK